MGTFVDPSGTVDPTLQSYILGSLVRRRRGAVVSTNAIVAEIRSALPGYQIEDAQMAKFISEAAMLLGLVPVFDPAWRGDVRSEDEPSFGYGYPAHRPDPSAVYVFSHGQPATLPVRGTRYRRLAR
jgi:hypothetical protein